MTCPVDHLAIFWGTNKNLRKILSKLNHFITGETTSEVQLLSTQVASGNHHEVGNVFAITATNQKKSRKMMSMSILRLKAANFKTQDFFVAIECYKGLVLDDGGWRHGDWHFDDLTVMNTL